MRACFPDMSYDALTFAMLCVNLVIYGALCAMSSFLVQPEAELQQLTKAGMDKLLVPVLVALLAFFVGNRLTAAIGRVLLPTADWTVVVAFVVPVIAACLLFCRTAPSLSLEFAALQDGSLGVFLYGMFVLGAAFADIDLSLVQLPAWQWVLLTLAPASLLQLLRLLHFNLQSPEFSYAGVSDLTVALWVAYRAWCGDVGTMLLLCTSWKALYIATARSKGGRLGLVPAARRHPW